MGINQLPSFLKKYFWDVDFRKLDYKKYPNFVIGRILEYGKPKSLHWMMANFSIGEIKKSIITSRELNPRSANFWADYFGLDKKEVKCLTKLFPLKQKVFWPY